MLIQTEAMSGKGDANTRITDRKAYGDNYDAIFRPKPVPQDQLKKPQER